MSAIETSSPSAPDNSSVEMEEDDEMSSEAKRRRDLESRLKQRHYKKDSRFLLDLYTLTFDEDETVDAIETCKTRIVSTEGNESVRRMSTSASPMTASDVVDDDDDVVKDIAATAKTTTRSMSLFERGPQSLGHFSTGPSNVEKSTRSGSIPSLETNLLKILARKIQDSEEISFRKAKLLTKAYYRMLRNNSSDFQSVQFPGTGGLSNHEYSSLVVTSSAPAARLQQQPKSFPPSVNRLSWQNLVRSSNTDLRRMVGGLENSAKVLNDYLVDLLLEKDDLLQDQDEMLEEISEITDLLLS